MNRNNLLYIYLYIISILNSKSLYLCINNANNINKYKRLQDPIHQKYDILYVIQLITELLLE